MKSVRIRSFAGLYLHIFGLDTERYGVSLRIHSECGKIRTRKTPNTDTFHAVYVKVLLLVTFLEAEIFKLVKTYWIPNIIFLKGCS